MSRTSFSEFKNNLWTAIISCPIVYVNHFHYRYVDDALKEVLSDNRISTKSIIEFDYGQGTIVDFETKLKNENVQNCHTVKDFLCKLVSHPEQLSDLSSPNTPQYIHLIKGIKGLDRDNGRELNEDVLSLLQTFATKYETGEYDDKTTIVIVSPEDVSHLPIALRKFVSVLEVSAPTPEEISDYIKSIDSGTDFENYNNQVVLDNLVRTLQGLQMYEVKQILRTILATRNHISSRAIDTALKEKKRIVKKSGIIEVYDTNISFDDVGGLQKLRDDLDIKCAIYSNLVDAKKYNVPIPKGILIIGMPGCGKSMIAKATANKFGVSLLRLDVSRLMGKYVGESEENLRLALATAEAAHPCVLWIDEIEKAFAGGNGKSGDNDMLVMRMMGHFLTWMQERETPVYIVATANDVMRPELMRKGRFDEVYFVDFPTEEERAQILAVKIKKYREAKDSIFDFSEIGDCREVVEDMQGEYGGFSGAEIECVLNMVIEKKFQAYLKEKDSKESDRRKGQKSTPALIKVTKEDFYEAVEAIKPSIMANQKSKEMDESEAMRDKTAIERIRDMQETFNFVNASR